MSVWHPEGMIDQRDWNASMRYEIQFMLSCDGLNGFPSRVSRGRKIPEIFAKVIFIQQLPESSQ
jgi:hypothetical protein